MYKRIHSFNLLCLKLLRGEGGYILHPSNISFSHCKIIESILKLFITYSNVDL